jgi:hypothetical protein
MNYKEKLPHLKDLAEILLNTPSSAAFIERYYTLCGNVCKTKCGNMCKDQIIKRFFRILSSSSSLKLDIFKFKIQVRGPVRV